MGICNVYYTVQMYYVRYSFIYAMPGPGGVSQIDHIDLQI